MGHGHPSCNPACEPFRPMDAYEAVQLADGLEEMVPDLLLQAIAFQRSLLRGSSQVLHKRWVGAASRLPLVCRQEDVQGY